MKACRGSRSMAPLILNLGARWRWAVSFMPWSLYPRKEPRYPLGGWVGPRTGLNILEKRKICCPSQHLNPRSFSLYPSYYTDYAIPAPKLTCLDTKIWSNVDRASLQSGLISCGLVTKMSRYLRLPLKILHSEIHKVISNFSKDFNSSENDTCFGFFTWNSTLLFSVSKVFFVRNLKI
jgi:hypothetical protein